MSWDRQLDLEAAIKKERDAVNALKAFADSHRQLIGAIWHWGDGDGGGILEIIARELGIQRSWEKPRETGYKKAKIDANLRRRVFERDAYRCKSCGGYEDLCCDHIVPESKGGPTTFENLQAMCRSCNSKKGARG
ncbi:hypothetical protein CCO03_17080 [Comamonas serinivorans]|uniref:HNH nuclease domain-containing protein n=1 Tax=Comamonas serinivorans TaxID=1082851 RepID=A0A1Y0ERW0_9BURK|nr:HNH endonuclease signature motif containing protein [Comamonas serinivorans]ARU06160.1 hypothetical protein CCO03_17080 [Comamonas serinivorans]